MREPDNIRKVAALGVDWMGFIFYAKSPRWYGAIGKELLLAEDTIPHIPQSVKKVGVFVNSPLEEVMKTVSQYKLDYVQLHGNESPDDCHMLQKRGYSLIKAFSVATVEDLEHTADYEERVDYFLFDTKCKGFGGSGHQFDWSVLAAYEGQTPFILSGGIRPDSVDAIIRFHHPACMGIDLNSGFETEPGLKDIDKLKSFVETIRKNK